MQVRSAMAKAEAVPATAALGDEHGGWCGRGSSGAAAGRGSSGTAVLQRCCSFPPSLACGSGSVKRPQMRARENTDLVKCDRAKCEVLQCAQARMRLALLRQQREHGRQPCVRRAARKEHRDELVNHLLELVSDAFGGPEAVAALRRVH